MYYIGLAVCYMLRATLMILYYAESEGGLESQLAPAPYASPLALLQAKPSRLHCSHCDETYTLPQNGTIKLYKELRCPLDDFELVLWSSGSRGKSYPLCPYCYNHPPFRDMKKGEHLSLGFGSLPGGWPLPLGVCGLYSAPVPAGHHTGLCGYPYPGLSHATGAKIGHPGVPGQCSGVSQTACHSGRNCANDYGKLTQDLAVGGCALSWAG